MKKEPYDYDTIRQASVESRKDIPIRKDNKERVEYIRREKEEIKTLENKTEFDKHRLILLSKLV